MSPDFDSSPQLEQVTPLERLRERVATWAALGLLMVFLFVTTAAWGYAAWWAATKLVSLFA